MISSKPIGSMKEPKVRRQARKHGSSRALGDFHVHVADLILKVLPPATGLYSTSAIGSENNLFS